MDRLDLRRLRLRPGERREERMELALDPFVLGGQRYDVTPSHVAVRLAITRASGATVFELELDARVGGPCMRCLAQAELEVGVRARELHEASAPEDDELRSEYVVDEHLLVGAWARDAIVLGIPEKVLCRPDCAGLCPDCGADLNVEPHEHVERVADPRWAVLERLRAEL
ncbi:MAG: DUF177 domain-containing protein [Thermoleophilia bacterium]|nr:DUF177 domain-containing protein [Gaiellaceae bacterium]MDW8337586.1 DUF177 domain-containing protein [Thermoleophilia bacterium]